MLSDVRQRTNMENSEFVTDAELTEYLNQELAELCSRLGLEQGQPFFRASTPFTVTVGTALYALPADFFMIQHVEATINGCTGPLRPFMQSEHAGLTSSTGWPAGPPVMYRVQGDNIEFLPATRAFTATVYYTPRQARLTAGSDTFDGFNGFEVAAIYGACATVLQKEDADPGFYLGQKERIYKHIDALATARDNAPERVQDVMSPDWAGAGEWYL